MNFRQKLTYTVLGAAIMLIGMLAANHIPLLTTQTSLQDASFGKITCTGLKIVNNENTPRITLRALSKYGCN